MRNVDRSGIVSRPKWNHPATAFALLMRVCSIRAVSIANLKRTGMVSVSDLLAVAIRTQAKMTGLSLPTASVEPRARKTAEH
jgi:hypothetical protein